MINHQLKKKVLIFNKQLPEKIQYKIFFMSLGVAYLCNQMPLELL